MIFIFLLYGSAAAAADFDTVISKNIDEHGIFDGSSGIVCCSAAENTLAMVTVSDGSFIFTLYGAENEITDTLTIHTGGRSSYRISIADYGGELGAAVYTNSVPEYFRPINDTLTLTADHPRSELPAAEYKKGKITALADPYDVYDTLNSVKLQKISALRYGDAALSGTDSQEILFLIKSAADIMDYDSVSSDLDTLTRHVLYTHENFRLISTLSPESGETGSDPSIRLCSSGFIEDAMYTAFRKTPEKPAVNMLTSLGYCFNDGSYYYTGGYNTYFATDVKDLVRVLKLTDDTLFVIFSDTYTEGGNAPIFEYSTAVVSRDSRGFYLKQLHMGGDIEIPREIIRTSDSGSETAQRSLLPAAVIAALTVLAVIGILIWLRLLHR